MITVVNRSTCVSDDDVKNIVAAHAERLPRFCSDWNRQTPVVRFVGAEPAVEVKSDATGSEPAAATPSAATLTTATPSVATPLSTAADHGFKWGFTIAIVDSGESKDTLSPHADAYVPAASIIAAGGKILYGDEKTPTVAAAVSQEVYNAIVDPYSNTWYSTGSSTTISGDICDPVIDGIITVRIGDASAPVVVGLSNYVLPEWSNPAAETGPGIYFDSLKTVRSPFGISAGGVAIYMNGTGERSTVCGKSCDFLALHARTAKPSSRAYRRLHGSALKHQRSRR